MVGFEGQKGEFLIMTKKFLKTGLLLFIFFGFYFISLMAPQKAQAMLLREKSLRESFFTKIMDEISLFSGQSLSQSIRLNYDNPLGVEIIFRNPSIEKAQGIFIVKDEKKKIIKEEEFSLESNIQASFHFFSFSEMKNPKGNNYLIEITNTSKIPLIVAYYNQDVYHYGQLYLGEKFKEGNLQFQIHYQISPIREVVNNFKNHLEGNRLFFLIWLVIIIFITLVVIILAKNYQIDKKKKQ